MHHNTAPHCSVQWSISIIQSSLTSSRLATGRSLTINACPLWVQTVPCCATLHSPTQLHTAHHTACTRALLSLHHISLHTTLLKALYFATQVVTQLMPPASLCVLHIFCNLHIYSHSSWSYISRPCIWYECLRKEKLWRAYNTNRVSVATGITSIFIIITSRCRGRSTCCGRTALVTKDAWRIRGWTISWTVQYFKFLGIGYQDIWMHCERCQGRSI